MTKPFEELDVIDDFLINAITSDPDVGEPFCRTVLSVLLQRKINKLKIIAQKTIPAYMPGFRGIRMDVEILEDIISNESNSDGPSMNIYDLEPHLQKDINFPKHNRFYQAKIDSNLMKSGDNDFSRMPNLYVLTITNFDIFGKDYMIYSFHNKCDEVPELEYDDGLKFIYFYTGGTKGGNKEIQAMLRYLQDSKEDNISNNATREIHSLVNKVKILPEVKKEYMRFEELMYYARQEGMNLGLKEGHEKGYDEGHKKGHKEGHAEGRAEGHAEGRAEGRAEGHAEGRAEGRAEGHAEGLSEGLIEGHREGIIQGLIQTIIAFLTEIGTIPDDLQKKISSETDVTTLNKWIKLAARANTIEDFSLKM